MPELFHYQETGAEFLAARRFALLADEPRVGKTPAVIRACDMVSAKSILVVCPAVARADWTRKFQEYSLFGRTPHPMFSHGNPPYRPEIVTSYSLVNNITYQRDWDALILDESHNLKGTEAKRTKSILGVTGIAHSAKKIWFVSGTPAPNNAAELWPMLHVCGVYKHSYGQFIRDFCKGYYDGTYGLRITGTKNHEKLVELMRGFMLRRTMAEVRPDIPPITFEDYAVTLGDDWYPDFPDKEYAINAKLEAALASGADPMAVIEQNASVFSSLRRYVGMMKVQPMVERVRALRLPKLVIFAIHRDVIDKLRVTLWARQPAVIHGGTSEREREDAKWRFTNDEKCRVFIGQIDAAGTNIDLSVANHCCILEASVTPGNNTQAVNRMQNVNKIEPTSCEFIGLANSVDERVQRIFRRKAADISKFIH